MKKVLSSLIFTVSVSQFYSAQAMESESSIINSSLEKFADQIQKTNKNIQKMKFDPQLFEMIHEDLPDVLKMYLALSPAKFDKRFPQRSLLLGEPGVGKSTLPNLIAFKHGYELEFVDCSLLSTEYKSSGCQNLAKILLPLINDVNKKIILLDEFNVITDKDSNNNDGDRDMSKALWVLLDKLTVTPHKVIATANAVKKVPAAIKSRFANSTFQIPLPSLITRKKIIKHYLAKENYMIQDENIEFLAKHTKSYTIRDIQSLIDLIHASADYVNESQKTNPKKYFILKKDIDFAFKTFKGSSELLNDSYATLAKDELKKHWPTILQIVITICFNYPQLKLAQKSISIADNNNKIAEKSYQIADQNQKVAEASLINQNQSLQVSKDSLAHQQRTYYNGLISSALSGNPIPLMVEKATDKSGNCCLIL